MKLIDAKNLDYKALNEELRQTNDDCIIEGCCGQRFIAAGMSDKSLTINGIPGNALGAYLNNANITVNANAQDAVGDTMNEGKILIHGNIGDAAGYAMRGGKIYVRGNAGYRAGIHMKAYKEKIPVMIIGGCAGSFLGEYQAGGIIIVLGLNCSENHIVGNFPCTGMHGGKMYLRGNCENIIFPAQVTAKPATNEDLDEIRVVRMFCTISYPDGRTFECDSRSILKQAVQDAEKAGLQFFFGAEQEFYLFNLDDNGNPTKEPYDNAGYMDIAPEDKGENIRREVCLTLEQMGIRPESSHHEEGPGQNEIDFRYSSPLAAADNAMTFQTVVKTVARRNGLYADFSPNPLEDKPGNGFHINMSVKSSDNADNMNFMIAGILAKVAEMTIFLNPVESSYQRFGNNKAPRYISWSSENRSQLVRVPAAVGEYKRAELRSPDPAANTYLAFALMIYASLYGIQNKLELQKPADINLYKADADTLAKFKQLPENLKTACVMANSSIFIKEHIPDAILEIYCNR